MNAEKRIKLCGAITKKNEICKNQASPLGFCSMHEKILINGNKNEKIACWLNSKDEARMAFLQAIAELRALAAHQEPTDDDKLNNDLFFRNIKIATTIAKTRLIIEKSDKNDMIKSSETELLLDIMELE